MSMETTSIFMNPTALTLLANGMFDVDVDVDIEIHNENVAVVKLRGYNLEPKVDKIKDLIADEGDDD